MPIKGRRKFAKGGVVPGSGNGDTVPAMLTPGEVVIPKGIAKENMSLLSSLMSGNVARRYAEGTLNVGEQDKQCAIREVKEETGLEISSDDFIQEVKIRNRAVYYYLEMKTCNIDVQDNMIDNDANGITWIKIKCLENAISDGNIVLNHYAKVVFNKLMNKTFPKSNWTIVNQRKK